MVTYCPAAEKHSASKHTFMKRYKEKKIHYSEKRANCRMCVFNNPLCFFKVYTYTLMCAGKHIDNCGMHIRVKEG